MVTCGDSVRQRARRWQAQSLFTGTYDQDAEREKYRAVVDELRGLVRFFDERENRAAVRLELQVGNYWWFAVLGLKTSVEDFTFL